MNLSANSEHGWTEEDSPTSGFNCERRDIEHEPINSQRVSRLVLTKKVIVVDCDGSFDTAALVEEIAGSARNLPECESPNCFMGDNFNVIDKQSYQRRCSQARHLIKHHLWVTCITTLDHLISFLRLLESHLQAKQESEINGKHNQEIARILFIDSLSCLTSPRPSPMTLTSPINIPSHLHPALQPPSVLSVSRTPYLNPPNRPLLDIKPTEPSGSASRLFTSLLGNATNLPARHSAASTRKGSVAYLLQSLRREHGLVIVTSQRVLWQGAAAQASVEKDRNGVERSEMVMSDRSHGFSGHVTTSPENSSRINHTVDLRLTRPLGSRSPHQCGFTARFSLMSRLCGYLPKSDNTRRRSWAGPVTALKRGSITLVEPLTSPISGRRRKHGDEQESQYWEVGSHSVELYVCRASSHHNHMRTMRPTGYVTSSTGCFNVLIPSSSAAPSRNPSPESGENMMCMRVPNPPPFSIHLVLRLPSVGRDPLRPFIACEMDSQYYSEVMTMTGDEKRGNRELETSPNQNICEYFCVRSSTGGSNELLKLEPGVLPKTVF
eukprot:GHVN01103681.1.p1 GENE.GHVN01103681.1~~GHVN01103681.1.p1  ORF type:complete len:551 (+),score=84.62 GHVN01103681.1:354-2006(+)